MPANPTLTKVKHKKHYKKRFENIPEDKRERILDAAINEFAKKGFSATNINIISEKAGISIGSMYNYFASKEDLFLTLVDRGYSLLEGAISSVDLEEGDIFAKIERLLRAAQAYSREYPMMTQIYQDMTSEGLSHLSAKLSRKMESISSRFYQALIRSAKQNGTVDTGLDEEVTSFCIDNLILILQFSYTSRYFIERLKIFVGDDAQSADERIIAGMMRFIRGGLASNAHNR